MFKHSNSETPVSGENHAMSLAFFGQYVAELKQSVKRQYDRSINKDLSRQNWQALFKRNVTSVLKQAYQDSLVQLQSVSIAPERMETKNGFSTLAVQALKPFDGFIEDIMQYALQKHRTSCALSNFPDEHRPSDDYIGEVIQETNRDWQAFASQVNDILMASSSN
jgi:monoamine oxidase